MDVVLVGAEEEFAEGSKRVVLAAGKEVGVFRLDGQFYAWLNTCPHQGGPVCQGRIFKRVLEVVDADYKTQGRTWSDTDLHIVCPWHGAEYNIRTGRHVGNDGHSLTAVDVSVEGGNVFLRIDADG